MALVELISFDTLLFSYRMNIDSSLILYRGRKHLSSFRHACMTMTESALSHICFRHQVCFSEGISLRRLMEECFQVSDHSLL